MYNQNADGVAFWNFYVLYPLQVLQKTFFHTLKKWLREIFLKKPPFVPKGYYENNVQNLVKISP